LKAGNDAIKARQREINIEDVQKLMDGIVKAKAYQDVSLNSPLCLLLLLLKTNIHARIIVLRFFFFFFAVGVGGVYYCIGLNELEVLWLLIFGCWCYIWCSLIVAIILLKMKEINAILAGSYQQKTSNSYQWCPNQSTSYWWCWSIYKKKTYQTFPSLKREVRKNNCLDIIFECFKYGCLF